MSFVRSLLIILLSFVRLFLCPWLLYLRSYCFDYVFCGRSVFRAVEVFSAVLVLKALRLSGLGSDFGGLGFGGWSKGFRCRV